MIFLTTKTIFIATLLFLKISHAGLKRKLKKIRTTHKKHAAKYNTLMVSHIPRDQSETDIKNFFEQTKFEGMPLDIVVTEVSL